MSNYTPIACSLHDQLEDAIIRRKSGRIVFINNDTVSEINDRVIDWINEKGEEFAVTESGAKIRLDRIITLFEIPFHKNSC